MKLVAPCLTAQTTATKEPCPPSERPKLAVPIPSEPSEVNNSEQELEDFMRQLQDKDSPRSHNPASDEPNPYGSFVDCSPKFVASRKLDEISDVLAAVLPGPGPATVVPAQCSTMARRNKAAKELEKAIKHDHGEVQQTGMQLVAPHSAGCLTVANEIEAYLFKEAGETASDSYQERVESMCLLLWDDSSRAIREKLTSRTLTPASLVRELPGLSTSTSCAGAVSVGGD